MAIFKSTLLWSFIIIKILSPKLEFNLESPSKFGVQQPFSDFGGAANIVRVLSENLLCQ